MQNTANMMSPHNALHLRTTIKGRSLVHDCDILGPWSSAFQSSPQLERNLGVRFPQIDEYDVDLSEVPMSIAVIPFLTNVLPIAWVFNANVYVESVDADFFKSQAELMQAYQKYYPSIKLGGGLIPGKIVENKIEEPQSPPIILFSGGVDASFTLWTHRPLKPIVATVRGSDIFFIPSDNAAWDIIKEKNNKIANDIGAQYQSIVSNFRIWLDYRPLDEISKSAKGFGWWHSHQHGPALVGLCAPLAWKLKSKSVSISSSFSSKDPSKVLCGSNPYFDESIRFFGVNVRHFDFTVQRQEKVAFLCEEVKSRNIDIPLRVCWQTRTGLNCCKCEKCLRTIFAIYAEDGDPQRFDFNATSAELEEAIRSPTIKMSVFWIEILKKLRNSIHSNKPEVIAALARGNEIKVSKVS